MKTSNEKPTAKDDKKSTKSIGSKSSAGTKKTTTKK